MPSLEMDGPYGLDRITIASKITRTSPGNYALGYINENQKFVVKYVGRADSDIRERLLAHVGGKYPKFKFSYASSPKAAFEKECKNYHDFGESEKLDNKIHPDRPRNATWKCPTCHIFD
ncbi:hypothetical protein ABEX29_01040 [Brevibacillus porteri]|uniref:hypothetical protein n=1 Tax=Brevibacillus porteri TaxID=2126350 RepID=UPI003D1D09F4